MRITIVGKGEDTKNIAAALGCKRFAFKEAKDGIILRYGNIRKINKYGNMAQPKFEINTIEAIKNARDKFNSLQMFKEAGLNVPTAQIETPEINNDIWFGRKFNHKKGYDIIVHKTQGSVDHDDVSNYFVKYVPINKEYRYHVFGNKIIQACIKYKEPGNGGIGDNEDIIRNLNHGWKFSEVKINETISEIAIKACRSLGLHFGAVDIILGKDKKYYVLEVNTAPGLDNKRLECYVKAFKEYIDICNNPNTKIPGKIKYPEWFNTVVNTLLNIETTDSRQNIEDTLLNIIGLYLKNTRRV